MQLHTYRRQGRCRLLDSLYSQNSSALFLRPGQPSSLLVLRANPQIPGSPALSQDSGSTFVQEEPTVDGNEVANVLYDTRLDGNYSSLFTTVTNIPVHATHNSDLRMFHIPHFRDSWSRLGISKDVFEELCSVLGVFDAFKHLIIYMGFRKCEVEVAPSRARWQYQQAPMDANQSIFECCYSLRYVQENHGRDNSYPWSLRQFAIYNKSVIQDFRSSWILVALPDKALADLTDCIREENVSSQESSLRMHLSLIEHAFVCWRPYLVYLTQEIEDCNGLVACASPSSKNEIDLSKLRVKLKNLEDQVIDAITALNGNKDTVSALLQPFRSIYKNRVAAGELHTDVQLSRNSFIAETVCDIDMTIAQLSSMRDKLTSCIQIASSFSQLSNGHSLSENGKSLRELAVAAALEAQHTAKMADKSRRDAAAVKALTIIALVYLPTTVVLNFFSASFIDTSSGDIVLVRKWWLFLLISLPLTILTLASWQLWMRFRLRRARHNVLEKPDEEEAES